ncbi:MAG TPA: polyhydroxyalkanoic acid system family protein [Thermoanaerobaculia bacterium]
MRIVIPHHTDKASARRRIEARLEELLGEHGHYLSEINQHWEGDRLVFSGTAKGFKTNGSVEITDSEVILDGKLPLIAKPFESRIKSTIEREASTIFAA